MERASAKRGHFALTRKFGGQIFSVWSLKAYDTRFAAEAAAESISADYHTRVVPWGDQYLVYIRSRSRS